ncbi:GNAT family N-acetyltransferase [Shewanella sp. JM162201]|uniref:GNAT family N-acetyltransferase n=1 Tax=Shewanella jiangmenensis TaxID=2837387 RepID=A0ABS5V2N3_9GAMM|nr:GNAT family N-acetyltransferase [Shewanella jiangmenensis]MBT1444708.1 GNAT family N-acetyltransferase [Shewanella jiangmenensis]
MTIPSLIIREAANDTEREAAAALIDRRDDHHHPLDRTELKRARLVLLAFYGEALVGTAAIKSPAIKAASIKAAVINADGHGESSDVAELGYLVVDKAFRRRGIGAALTAARIDWARAQGIRLLWATVRDENHASRDNLVKAGWQFFGNYLSIRGTGNTIGWYVLALDLSLSGVEIASLMAPIIGERVAIGGHAPLSRP